MYPRGDYVIHCLAARAAHHHAEALPLHPLQSMNWARVRKHGMHDFEHLACVPILAQLPRDYDEIEAAVAQHNAQRCRCFHVPC